MFTSLMFVDRPQVLFYLYWPLGWYHKPLSTMQKRISADHMCSSKFQNYFLKFERRNIYWLWLKWLLSFDLIIDFTRYMIQLETTRSWKILFWGSILIIGCKNIQRRPMYCAFDFWESANVESIFHLLKFAV